MKFEEYGPTKKKPVRLVDSRGLERDNLQQRTTLEKYINQRAKGGQLEQIHCVWYVVMASQRWEEADTTYCQTFLKDIPIIIVLSKCDVATETQMTAIESVIKVWIIAVLFLLLS
jgi:GTPase Era involved in 16S rRNA processing